MCHIEVGKCCRELERHPDVLVPAMPQRPDHFAAMEATLAPRPRTRKMIGMMVCPCALQGNASEKQKGRQGRE